MSHCLLIILVSQVPNSLLQRLTINLEAPGGECTPTGF